MYKLILAFRYLIKRRVSYLALTAVGLCVFIVVVVMTVMTGLVGDFKEKNHRYVGDCVVGTESLVGFPYYDDFLAELEGSDFVEAACPVITSYGLVGVSGSEQGIGVEVVGIDPARHFLVTGLGESLHYHKAEPHRAFELAYDSNRAGCVVGVDLWLRRSTRGEYSYDSRPAATALVVTCFPLTVRGALAKAGTDLANSKTFCYSDSSHSGLARVDSSTVYLPFDQLQLLCGMTEPAARASSIHIKFKPGTKLEAGCSRVAELWRKFTQQYAGERYCDLFETVRVQSWKEHRRQFIAAMEKEQTMMTAMFGLVGLTTVFIVFVVFYMIVSHKSKDIGILKSIGVSRANLVALFLLFAFLLGLIGSAVGVVCGILFLRYINGVEDWLFERFGFQIWDRTIYAIGDIPNEVHWSTLAVIVLCAAAACLAGAWLATRRAAKLEPVKTLQVTQL